MSGRARRPSRPRARAALALALGLALAGAAPAGAGKERGWRLLYGDAAHTGTAGPGPAARPKPAWTRPVGTRRGAPVSGEAGRVYLADRERLLALDLGGGATVWEAGLTDAASTGAVLTDALVVAVTEGAAVRAYAREGGELRWSRQLDLPVFVEPTVAGDLLLVEATSPISESAESLLYALAASDGRVAWRARYPGGLERAPAAAGDLVLVATRGALRAFERRKGKPVWSHEHPPGSVSAPVSGGGRVFYWTYASGVATVRAVELRSGKPVWRRELQMRVNPSPLALAEGLLLLGVPDTGLVALDAKDGSGRFTAPEGGSLEAQPVAGGGLAYWAADDWLHATRLEDGSLVWSERLPGAGRHFALVGGTLLVQVPEAGLLALR